MPGHAALPIVARNGSLLLIKTIDFVTQKSALHALPVDAAARTRKLLGRSRRDTTSSASSRGEILIETDLDAPRGRIVALDPAASALHLRESRPAEGRDTGAVHALDARAVLDARRRRTCTRPTSRM